MSKMLLSRPLITFDLETTGLDPATDRIVQFCIIKTFPNSKKSAIKVTRLVNPCIVIPKEASDIHGITNDMLEEAPLFSDIAKPISEFIKGCDVVGYNSNRFDIPFLLHEFERAGIFDAFLDVEFIDVFNLYCKFNPRTLEQAYADYCHKKLDAHSADNDAIATLEVLNAIVGYHSEEIKEESPEGPTVEALAKMSKKNKNVDILGVIVENDQGLPVFAFGKHKGCEIKKQRDYCKWILNAPGFTENTKQHIKRILNEKAKK